MVYVTINYAYKHERSLVSCKFNINIFKILVRSRPQKKKNAKCELFISDAVLKIEAINFYFMPINRLPLPTYHFEALISAQIIVYDSF